MMEESRYLDLYEKMVRLHWLMQRHQMQSHAQHGPTGNPARGQGRVLAMLKIQPEISTKDLSYLLGIRQQSLNELLNKLEKSGHVVREPSEQDKRVMMIKLTEKGRQEQQEEADFGDIFTCLNEEEQVVFADYLDRIIDALEAQLGDEKEQDLEEWIRSVRAKVGNEQFERIMAMMHYGRQGGKCDDGRGPGRDRRGRFDAHREGRFGPGFPFGRRGDCGDFRDPPPPPPPPHEGPEKDE